MEIKTKAGVYTVYENVSSWKLKRTVGKVDLCAEVSKKDCQTFEDLKAFIEKEDQEQ